MASWPPHVLVFPFPIQGPINCLFHFATGLAAAGLCVTFLHTDHNLRRLERATPAAGSPPRLRFLSVPDGLPDSHPRSVRVIEDIMDSLRTKCSVAYRALLASLRAPSDGFPPVTCVVADGLLPFGVDVAEELGVPAISFRTVSACSFLAYLSVPKLLELGQLPFPQGGDLDELVRGVPGMESFLRRRDLPSLCRNLTATPHDDPGMPATIAVTAHSRTARALVLNTSLSLESSALAQIAPHMRDVFAIGPLHAMSPAPAAGATSLWHEDTGCMAWLDGQADRSVVYVSLGSLAVITRQQLQELLAGLVATGYAFLWVLRAGAVEATQDADAAAIREEAVRSAGSGRVNFVAWAPQRDVLRHRAVGCFLTHAGWNSTLEAAVEGVPMVCWPQNVDQHINSRFVGAVWRTGLDMKDVCDRVAVESMVREAMESAEMRGTAQALAEQVRRDIAEGGSSAMEFQRLLRFIEELGDVVKHTHSRTSLPEGKVEELCS